MSSCSSVVAAEVPSLSFQRAARDPPQRSPAHPTQLTTCLLSGVITPPPPPPVCVTCSASLKDPQCRVPWSTFCADPWSAAEALHDRGCIKRSKSYLYFHIADQFHCMRTAEGGWAVDFIGSVDQPNDDWAEVRRTLGGEGCDMRLRLRHDMRSDCHRGDCQGACRRLLLCNLHCSSCALPRLPAAQVVKTLNARRAPDAPELPVGELEQQNVRRGAESDPYSASHTQCFDAVSRWYACDIENYGFAGAAATATSSRAGQQQV